MEGPGLIPHSPSQTNKPSSILSEKLSQVCFISAQGHKVLLFSFPFLLNYFGYLVHLQAFFILYLSIELDSLNLDPKGLFFWAIFEQVFPRIPLGILRKILLKVLNPSRRIHLLWLVDDSVGFTGCTSSKGKCHRSIKSGEFRVRDLKLFKLSCASLLDYSAYFKSILYLI